MLNVRIYNNIDNAYAPQIGKCKNDFAKNGFIDARTKQQSENIKKREFNWPQRESSRWYIEDMVIEKK